MGIRSLLHKVVIRLPLPDQEMLSVFHHNLRSPRPAVIVGAHRKTICAGAQDSKIFTLLDPFEFSLPGEKIAGFAYRADNIAEDRIPFFRVTGMDVMICFVQ